VRDRIGLWWKKRLVLVASNYCSTAVSAKSTRRKTISCNSSRGAIKREKKHILYVKFPAFAILLTYKVTLPGTLLWRVFVSAHMIAMQPTRGPLVFRASTSGYLNTRGRPAVTKTWEGSIIRHKLIKSTYSRPYSRPFHCIISVGRGDVASFDFCSEGGRWSIIVLGIWLRRARSFAFLLFPSSLFLCLSLFLSLSSRGLTSYRPRREPSDLIKATLDRYGMNQDQCFARFTSCACVRFEI